jgi:O-antigen/teichoic acid export membrane protein
MGIAYKSLLIFSNRAITALFPIVMAAILIRMIDTATFGLYRQVTAVALFVSSIFSLNLDQSLYYFIPRLPEREHRNFIAQTVFQAALLGCCAGVLLWLSAGRIAEQFAGDPSLNAPLKAYSLFVAAHIVIGQVPAALISKDRVLAAGLFKIFQVALRCGVVILAFVHGQTLTEVMWTAAFTTAAVAVAGVVVLLCYTSGPALRISLQSVREQFLYVFPLAIAALAGLVGMYVDKWVVMYFFSSEEFGIYSVGAIQIPMVMFVASSLMHAMMPSIVRLYEKGDRRSALALWHKGIRKAALVLFPAFVCLLVLSGDIIEVIFGAEYIEAVGPFVVYLALIPVRVAVYSTLLRAAGKTRPVFYAAVTAVLLNVILSCVLVIYFRGTYMAFISPALATVVSVFVSALYQLVMAGRVSGVSMRMAFPWKTLGGLMACAVICAAGVVPVLLIFDSGLLRIVPGALAYILCYALAISKADILDKSERQILFYPLVKARRFAASRFDMHSAG